jgi:hypothetical protein
MMRSTLAATAAAALTALALLAGSGVASARQEAPVSAADHGGITVTNSRELIDVEAQCDEQRRRCILKLESEDLYQTYFGADFHMSDETLLRDPKTVQTIGCESSWDNSRANCTAFPEQSRDAGWVAQWAVSVKYGERFAADQTLQVTGIQCDSNTEVCVASFDDMSGGNQWVAQWAVDIERP